MSYMLKTATKKEFASDFFKEEQIACEKQECGQRKFKAFFLQGPVYIFPIFPTGDQFYSVVNSNGLVLR